MNNKRSTRPQPSDTFALAGIAGQAGCVTLIVVIIALVLGVWLDGVLHTRQAVGFPVATIVLVLVSVPVSVVLMIRTVLSGMARFHQARGNRPVGLDTPPIGGIWRRDDSQPGGAADQTDLRQEKKEDDE